MRPRMLSALGLAGGLLGLLTVGAVLRRYSATTADSQPQPISRDEAIAGLPSLIDRCVGGNADTCEELDLQVRRYSLEAEAGLTRPAILRLKREARLREGRAQAEQCRRELREGAPTAESYARLTAYPIVYRIRLEEIGAESLARRYRAAMLLRERERVAPLAAADLPGMRRRLARIERELGK